MKARTQSLLDFIQDGSPFEIPVYQRMYSWKVENCKKLWEDAMRVGRDRNPYRTHFIGSIIYIENVNARGRAKRFIIDGQQRIATAILLIEALARSLGEGVTVAGLTAKELRRRYLMYPDASGNGAYKLLMSRNDRESLKAVLKGGELPNGLSLRIRENFEWFMSKFDDAGTTGSIYNGLRKLNIVAAELNRKRDNPQNIFENMNTKKLPLTMSDLIRNFVLLGMDPDDQTELYKKHWRPMEEGFDQKTYAKDFDDFIRYYLAFKNGKMPVIRRLYDEFQNFAEKRIRENRGNRRSAVMKEIVADLQKFAGYFCKMKLEKEENLGLKQVFKTLQELKANSLFPLLLGMYDDYAANGVLSTEQFEKAGWILESYTVRRLVCGIGAQGLNRAVPTYYRFIGKDRYIESLGDVLQSRPTSERFPRDAEFEKELLYGDVSLATGAYLLRPLENHEEDKPLDLDGYEVECILPQLSDGSLPDEWKRALGTDWQELHPLIVNNLGNLTLIKKDADVSAQDPFSVKRKAYQNSGLWLNNGSKGPARVDQWNAEAIQERAKNLAEIALDIWPMP